MMAFEEVEVDVMVSLFWVVSGHHVCSRLPQTTPMYSWA